MTRKVSHAQTATRAMAAAGTAPGQPAGRRAQPPVPPDADRGHPDGASSSVPNSASGGTPTPDGKRGGGNSVDPTRGIEAIRPAPRIGAIRGLGFRLAEPRAASGFGAAVRQWSWFLGYLFRSM